MIPLLLGALLVVWVFYHMHWKRRGLPPGPVPFPILGNILMFKNKTMLEVLIETKEKYGDVNTLWFGNQPMFSVHDAATIQEYFVKDGDNLSGRETDMRLMQFFRKGLNGLINVDGPRWREHRRFTLTVLRDFGLGKNLMQEKVLDEVTWLIGNLRKRVTAGEKDISVQRAIDIAVGSIINNILFGYRFSEGREEEFFFLKNANAEFIRRVATAFYRFVNPSERVMRLVPPLHRSIIGSILTLRNFVERQIDEHRKHVDFSVHTEPTDYAEAFMRHQKKLNDEGVTDHTFSDAQLYSACLDLWSAGQETTSSTLSWLVIYVMQNEHVQRRLHAELSREIGSDRVVTLNDKANLPYVNAVVAEAQRFCNLLSMNVPHRILRDTNIGGYSIPADSIVVNQIGTLLYDERYFPNARSFRPERFLDAEGKFAVPSELMPFGVGKRACLGEGLARLELFLFTANLFNQFEIRPVPGAPRIPDRTPGMINLPDPFTVDLKIRQQ